LICKLWESQLQFWIFSKEKNTNNSKANTDDVSLPTSTADIPIFENLQTKSEKSKSMKFILVR
jgi:hypothetical protein